MFSAPTVDLADGLVFGTFGQPYTEPANVVACNAAAPGGFSESCEQPGAYWKSIVAFSLSTGTPVWSYRVFGSARWQRACGAQPPQVTWCAAQADGGKGGVYYLFDAKTGALIWNTLVGPGGDQGGFEWGTAYDGRRIYGSLTNQILWQTADPQTETLPTPLGTVGVWDLGPVSVANGVVFVSSMAKSGHQMFALDAATGQILWQFDAGSSVNAAPTVVNGSV